MADISRAMNTPPPATQQQPQATPQPAQPTQRIVTVPDDVKAAAAREAKNERDRLRRKAQRAAALKAAEAATAKPKKKKAKKRKQTLAEKIDAGFNTAGTLRTSDKRKAVKAAASAKAKRRGRPPGAKNKPKLGLAVALVPAPGVLSRGRAKVAPLAGNSLLAQINSAVLLLNAMPEHARKVVLDAVK